MDKLCTVSPLLDQEVQKYKTLYENTLWHIAIVAESQGHRTITELYQREDVQTLIRERDKRN